MPHTLLPPTVLILITIWATSVYADERLEFFESRIRPVLVEHCYECHSAASSYLKAELNLDFRDGILNGGESGPTLIPGKPEESLILESLRYESFEMPPSGQLPQEVIADFEKWIRDGAFDPREKPSENDAAEQAWKDQLAERSRWWSLQPPKYTTPPQCDDPQWSVEPIDQFIYSRLRDEGLSPAAPATANTLLRRLTFVLTGLPPSLEQVQSFPSKYRHDPERSLAQLVDHLLDSPHFGERFARHWMDVVRYTDTYGYEWDIPAKGSWEYRDYLIRAFNNDIGFDQLIREQIAGDLLPNPRINHADGLNESMIGPMFFHLGEHRHGSSLAFNGIHQEMIDNKIDAFSKTFLAMTVGCARCHDHKLDAISQADYYALAGIFMTPRWTARPIDAPNKYEPQITELTELRSTIHQQLGREWITNQGALSSGSRLREWAFNNRKQFDNAKMGDIAWPFNQLTGNNSWLKSNAVLAEASTTTTQLTISSDGAILASGPVPERDSYKITFRTEPGTASLLRLEALTHNSLGSKGPGRTSHGNFVLSNIEASVKPIDSSGNASTSSLTVPLSAATADYSQPNYPVISAINTTPGPGWGVGLGGNVDRTARFYFSNQVDLSNGGEWTIDLDFNLGSQHILGCFRLSIGGQVYTHDPTGQEITKDAKVIETWSQLSLEWENTHESRILSNQKFHQLTDFSTPELPAGWVMDGAGMRHGYVVSGTPLINLRGQQILSKFLKAGYHTRALSPKLPGALRLPNLDSFNGQRVTLELAGGEWSGRRDIPQNAFLNEGPTFFHDKSDPKWTGFSATAMKNGVSRVLTEITTSSLNSNFPPRTGVANAGGIRLPDNDEDGKHLSWFSMTGMVRSNGTDSPKNTLNEFASLYKNKPPHSEEMCWQYLRDWLVSAVDRWANDLCEPNDDKLLNWMLSTNLLANDRESFPQIANLIDHYREVEATIDFPRSVNSMDERGVQPVDYRLNIRGDVYREGDPVKRRFLEVFAGQNQIGNKNGSGRLELADYLSDQRNPQTARVIVNRVWQWIFGTGLVGTPSDFGKLGDRPTHPELLDWLAIQFMNENWSIKKLIRRLAISQTFRQSGNVNEQARSIDPSNKLLHHYPTRRLEAEAIRDSLLSVSGSLDSKLYGRPINPPRATEDSKKRLFSGPLDGNRRRSIYLEMSIMDPPKFLLGFNLPDLKLPTGRRDQTNVPAQALMMLNDPFVIQQADRWAQRLLNDECEDVQERIRLMFLQALGRMPNNQEVQRWTNAIREFSQSDDVMKDHDAWSELAHTFFNHSEFLYYR